MLKSCLQPQLSALLNQVGQDHSVSHLAMSLFSVTCHRPSPYFVLLLLLLSMGLGGIFNFDWQVQPLPGILTSCTELVSDVACPRLHGGISTGMGPENIFIQTELWN